MSLLVVLALIVAPAAETDLRARALLECLTGAGDWPHPGGERHYYLGRARCLTAGAALAAIVAPGLVDDLRVLAGQARDRLSAEDLAETDRRVQERWEVPAWQDGEAVRS